MTYKILRFWTVYWYCRSGTLRFWTVYWCCKSDTLRFWTVYWCCKSSTIRFRNASGQCTDAVHYASGQRTDAVHYASGQRTDAVNLTHAVECTKQLRLVLSGTWCGECINERSGPRRAEEGGPNETRKEVILTWQSMPYPAILVPTLNVLPQLTPDIYNCCDLQLLLPPSLLLE